MEERRGKMNEDRTERDYSLLALYEEYMPLVYRTAFLSVKDHSKAETLVRDSFLDLAESGLRFRNKRQIRGFLIVAVAERCKGWPDCDPQESEIQQNAALRYLREQEGYNDVELEALICIWRRKA